MLFRDISAPFKKSFSHPARPATLPGTRRARPRKSINITVDIHPCRAHPPRRPPTNSKLLLIYPPYFTPFGSETSPIKVFSARKFVWLDFWFNYPNKTNTSYLFARKFTRIEKIYFFSIVYSVIFTHGVVYYGSGCVKNLCIKKKKNDSGNLFRTQSAI